MGTRGVRNAEIGVRFPVGPLRPHGDAETSSWLCAASVRVSEATGSSSGSSSKGKMPVRQTGDPGSIPGGSTRGRCGFESRRCFGGRISRLPSSTACSSRAERPRYGRCQGRPLTRLEPVGCLRAGRSIRPPSAGQRVIAAMRGRRPPPRRAMPASLPGGSARLSRGIWRVRFSSLALT